ncbi:hypothetical protein CPB85DRAFT_1378555 [Mucidula mucida]|nr:hypothetical protein CPB85DRAFT_1378555 [Mucidula mucida]
MSNLHLNVNTSGGGSPGSSVFDLPVSVAKDQHSPSPARLLPPANTEQAANNSISFVVLSGGTGGNAICSAFGNACYVLPVSDDGGSSSEIIRVIGGPSIGDIRSRLIRLIPPASPGSPLDAIPREEWRDIVEGTSKLWQGIPNDRKETIRGFLVYFESELLKRAHKNFTFVNGSIGNYFLAAAQGFFRSLPSAVFLFSSITNSQANILPVIVTNHTVTIAAELENGERLVGQCEISHPVSGPSIVGFSEPDPWSPVETQRQNVMFEAAGKSTYEPLASRINKLFYINAYGMEIHPSPNPDYLSSLSSHDVLVYSCGSLWTSIIPCLALRGVASAIARSTPFGQKLNAKNDRETHGYTAEDYILAVTRTLNAQYQRQTYGLGSANTIYPISAFITDCIHVDVKRITVCFVECLLALGVRCTQVQTDGGDLKFEAGSVRQVIDTILTARTE